jgi:hypothetical protein
VTGRSRRFPRAARGGGRTQRLGSALALATALGASALAAGCGGGSPATAGEPAKTFPIEIVRASFPAKQSIAKHERLLLTVRNRSSEAIPNLVATVDSFNYASNFPELSANKRPVWVIERGPGAPAPPPVQTQEVSIPGGGQTAYVNTWALGVLPAHQTETFFWSVVPVKAGAWTVRYLFSAGLAGKAKARLAAGGPAAGHFHVVIAPKPPETHVDPKTGQVVPGPYAGNKAELGP